MQSYRRISLQMGDKLHSNGRPGFFQNIANKFGGSVASGGKKHVSIMGSQVKKSKKIVIVGAGISGLACANELKKAGETDFVLLEASDAPGGRIRTDNVDGYLLDRGFQVFIEEYPEAKALFDYKKLDLKQFLPGAMVRYDKSFYKVADPFRRPQDLLNSLTTPIGSFMDKVNIGIFAFLVRFFTLRSIFMKCEVDTETYLTQSRGLSRSMIERFFAPFYQGIFLSPLKYQSSRMFEFVFKMFTEGAASLPAGGMQEICEQVANNLPDGSIRYNNKVISTKPGEVKVSTNKKIETYECESIVLAADPPALSKLSSDVEIPDARKSTCLYYGFEGLPPIQEPLLILNGETYQRDFAPDSVTINNVCFPSQVSKKYAPEGYSLASVTVVGAAEGVTDKVLEEKVYMQLIDWFGESVETWKFLKSYRVSYAQPAQTSPHTIEGKPAKLSDGIFICGDHRGTATLNGAIESGRRAAMAVLE